MRFGGKVLQLCEGRKYADDFVCVLRSEKVDL